MIPVPAAAFLVLAANSSNVAPADPVPGCTVYHDGTVFTGTADRPDANWFVVENGAFAAVGGGPGLPDAGRRCAAAVDLRGQFVMAGFIDAHVHLADGGFGLLQTDLGPVRTRSELAAGLAAAAKAPVGGWVIARNLGLEPFGGKVPTHAEMDGILSGVGPVPVIIALRSGHHWYVNRIGVERLGIRPGPLVPAAANGHPQGILVDEAAWDALRAVYAGFPPGLFAEAIDRAQRLALTYGVTAVQDNTFFPLIMGQYVRMSHEGVLRLRVSCRSFGAEPVTRFLMRSMGRTFTGAPDPLVSYFGDKYFVDGSLSAGSSGPSAGAPAALKLAVPELRDAFLLGGKFGLAFHVQSVAGLNAVLDARAAVGDRRERTAADVIDHCGSCGPLAQKIAAAGFGVTLLPGQLHDLPVIAAQAPGGGRDLLRFRELFAAGLRPALTSDWPYGSETLHADLPGGTTRAAFSPLALVAIAVSGRSPNGEAIPLAGDRTIALSEALKAYTLYPAALLGGHSDLGAIAAGRRADFVVLPRSPFEIDPVNLYRLDVAETFIEGQKVFDRAGGEPPMTAGEIHRRFGGAPSGRTLSPVIGYEPGVGLLLGGAVFFYPYEPRGAKGSAVVITAPFQLRANAELEAAYPGLFGRVSPRATLKANTFRYYYGFGNGSVTGDEFLMEPVRVESAAGVATALGGRLELGTYALYSLLREGTAARIDAASAGKEGPVEGSAAGARLEIVFDSRDNFFSTKTGGRRTLWVNGWGLQADEARRRVQAGAEVTQFLLVYAPEVVLALRAQGGVSGGAGSYLTNFSLGGSDVLRGYYGNRLRGEHFAAATAELRFPIAWIVSAAVFGEAGRVWPKEGADGRDVHVTGGGGLRFGLPPDGLIKLRFDAGIAPGQWALAFKFNEAF